VACVPPVPEGSTMADLSALGVIAALGVVLLVVAVALEKL
jgi:hypothetical protein